MDAKTNRSRVMREAVFVAAMLALPALSCGKAEQRQQCLNIAEMNLSLQKENANLRRNNEILSSNNAQLSDALKKGVCPFQPKSEATVAGKKEDSQFSPVGGGFSSRKVSFSSMSGGFSKYRGEMKNGNRREIGQAFFKLAVYDDSGDIVETDTIIVPNFAAGDVRVFDGVIKVSPKKIATTRIQFEGTN